MRRINCLLLVALTALLSVPSKVYADDSEPSVYKRGTTYLESTLPPSPEPASVLKLADLPINYCMGRMQLEIPLYTFQGNEISLPLRLSYASGGIKLDEIAGVAGLGWTLDAGGCITRTVMDMPDEFSSIGFCHQMPSDELLAKLEDPSVVGDIEKDNYLTRIVNHWRDTKLDRYDYSVCGLNGSFVILDSGEVFQLSGDGVKISYTRQSGAISKFTVVGPDGTKYTLSEKETGEHDGTGGEIPPVGSGQRDIWSATTAWYLTKIESRSGLEQISFTYIEGDDWIRDIYSRSQTKTVQTGNLYPTITNSGRQIKHTYSTKLLNSISFSGTTATFEYASTGNIAPHTGSSDKNYPHRLSRILITNSAGRQIRQISLGTARDSNDGRVVLNSLSIKGPGGGTIDRWSFNYDTRSSTVSHYSQDYYGYYNGSSSGTYNGICPYNYRNSDDHGVPDSAEAKYMSMTSYSHNGAVSDIEYEGNSRNIGIRVKSITSYGSSYDQVRSFSYGEAAFDRGTTASASRYTTVYAPLSPGDMMNSFPPTYTWSYTLHEEPVGPGASLKDAKVYYKKVTESVLPRQVSFNMKVTRTVRYFDTSATSLYGDYVFSSFPSSINDLYTQHVPFTGPERDPFLGVIQEYEGDGSVCQPVLTRQEEYECLEPGEYRLVSATNYAYDHLSTREVLVEYSAEQVWHPLGIGNCPPEYIYHYPVYAWGHSGRNLLSEEHVEYHPDGSRDSTAVNYTWLSRGANLELPSRLASASSHEGGTIRRVEYEYADSSDLSYAYTLAGQHYIQDALRTKYYIEQDNLLSPNPVPWKTETREFTNNIPGTFRLMPSAHREYTLGQESWSETVLTRDGKGNVRQIKEKGKPNTVILWSYCSRYPVALIENATLSEVSSSLLDSFTLSQLSGLDTLSLAQQARLNRLREDLPSAHVTTFVYEPGVGVISRTDPSGIKTAFEYDAAGRLRTVKDAEGNPVKDYDYDLTDYDEDGRLSVRSRVYLSALGGSFMEYWSWWDTFGVKLQDVAVGACGIGVNLVTAYGCDHLFHDDVRTWLPYAVYSPGANFQQNAEAAAAQYHNSDKAYFHKTYEWSNRDKVIATALPGYDGDHETIFSQGAASLFPKYRWYPSGIFQGSSYDSTEVVKEITTDADGRVKTVFRDHFGRTLGTGIGTDEPTYYIYDLHDRLSAVAGSGIALSDTLSMWRYSYDGLDRLKSKGIPGSISESYVYDSEDRIISMKKGNVHRTMTYDAFGRVLTVHQSDSISTVPVLMESHTYDAYPAFAEGSVFLSHISSWNGPAKGLEIFKQTARIDEDGCTDGYVQTLLLYDSKARLAKSVSLYPDGDVLQEEFSYNFPGKLISTVSTFTRGASVDSLTVNNSYGRMGEILTSTSILHPSSGSARDLSTSYRYDTIKRPCGSVNSTADGFSLYVTDSLTLQGWMAKRAATLNGPEGRRVFRETLGYDSGDFPSYTGLVCSREVAVTDRLIPSTESYRYDYAGRLSREATGSGSLAPAYNYSYDARGNILSRENFRLREGEFYTYSGDRVTGLRSERNGRVILSYNFTYDDWGRMTWDGRSSLQMEYNSLSLPRKISHFGINPVNFSYLADGTKESSLKSSGAGLVYRGPFVYRRASDGTLTLESVECAGGRLLPDRTLAYVRDHLGSVCAVIDADTEEYVEASTYSTYGGREEVILPLGTLSDLPLRDHFTGQEDQKPEFGLPYSDHGARLYSPDLRRWMVPDPLSEKYYGLSPYCYCADNPLNLVDLDGKKIVVYPDGKIKSQDNSDKNVYVSHEGKEQLIGHIDETIEATSLINNCFRDNIITAHKMNPIKLRSLVKNHGNWDLKNNKETIWGILNKSATTFLYEGEELSASDVGNMHFGAVVKSNIFIPEKFALWQAGKAQISAGTSKEEWKNFHEYTFYVLPSIGVSFKLSCPPYGDDPQDQRMIKKGFQWYETNK